MNEISREDWSFFQVFNEIGIINQLSTNIFTKALPDGLKISQFGVLNHFVRLGDGSTPFQLANAFQVTKGAMTNTLKRLLDKELINIKPDPEDGRSKRVFITKKGRTMRNKCIQSLVPNFNLLKESFTAQDFEKAIPFLQELREMLDEGRNPKKNT
ncbi:MAG: MarR family transcriptional regulator [Proteobacteria bacterium]|nr:MarR family transcriptional regulator [Pseudomonadota bacterium]